MQLDSNKIIQTLSMRNANKQANMEQEIAFLLVENEELKKENKKLKEQQDKQDQETK